MQDERPVRQGTGADWIIPTLAAAFAAYYLWSISNLVWEAKMAAVFVAVVLFVLIGIFFAKSLFGLARHTSRFELRSLYDNWPLFRVRALLFGLTILSVALLPWIGFTISTFGFLLASFLWLARMSVKMAVITALSLALFAYGLFIAILDTAFPPGPFEWLMNTLFGL